MAQCIHCHQEVRPRQHSLMCDGCDRWQHRTCATGVSIDTYRHAVQTGDDIDWRCTDCEPSGIHDVKPTLGNKRRYSTTDKPRMSSSAHASSSSARASSSSTRASSSSARASSSSSHRHSSSYSTRQSLSSLHSRVAGNAIFKTVTGGLSFTTSCSRLKKALDYYVKAIERSDCHDDSVSAYKNAAVTSRKLATLHVARNSDDHSVQVMIRDYYKKSLSYYGKAYIRRSCKSREYQANLTDTMRSCYTEMSEWLQDKGPKTRANILSDMVLGLPESRVKATSYISLATLLFHNGITAWHQKDYKECHRCMKECYFPIQEARRLREGDTEIKEQAQTLEEDVYLHTCIAESRMARQTGEDLLAAVVQNQEYLNIDMMWIIIDWFTQAILLCSEKDLEQEAITNASLGGIYAKVLKLKDRAKTSYRRAVDLAFSMEPRNFDTYDWFRECTTFLREYQLQSLSRDEMTEERQQALAQIQNEVKKLNSWIGTNHTEFLSNIYKTWPPKNTTGKGVTAPDSTLAQKKQLMKALVHYHPDRQDKERFGVQWYYLCEEITKVLNSRYAECKG